MKTQKLRKNLLIVSLVFAFLFYANLLAEIKISGSVKSATNSPLKTADIFVFDGKYQAEPIAKATASENGIYNISFPDNQIEFWIDFAAPNCQKLRIPLICFKNQNYTIDVNLQSLYFESPGDSFEIIGDFNDFSFDKNTIKMTKLANGNYIAKVPKNKDTLAYQILINTANFATKRSINGQQADFYKPDASLYDYISYIVSSENSINIEFNPNKINSKSLAASVKSNNSAVEKLYQFSDTVQNIHLERDRKIFELMEKNELKDEVYDSLKLAAEKKIVALFDAANEKEFKIYLALYYLELLLWGGSPQNVDTNMIKFISVNLPLEYFKLNGRFLTFCELESDFNKENLLGNKRLQKHLAEIDKNSGEYPHLCQEIVVHYMRRQDTLQAKIYYDILYKEFPENSNLLELEKRYNFYGIQKILVGKTIPDFELANLDSPGETISMQKLRGKWVLIDIWYQGCGPCVAEIPNFREIYKKYKSKGFEIYSIGFDSPESIHTFKSNPKYEMPWLHSYSGDGDWKSPMAKLLEVTFAPTCILVSPEGKIVEMNNKLRGANLGKTLAELIK